MDYGICIIIVVVYIWAFGQHFYPHMLRGLIHSNSRNQREAQVQEVHYMPLQTIVFGQCNTSPCMKISSHLYGSDTAMFHNLLYGP